jgi:hypothetical protein
MVRSDASRVRRDEVRFAIDPAGDARHLPTEPLDAFSQRADALSDPSDALTDASDALTDRPTRPRE